MTHRALPDKLAEAGWFGCWYQRGVLLAIVLACAVALSANPADPDLWGHVQYGRDVISTGRLPQTTTYSYAETGYRWVNHENLSEIIFAVIADSAGPIGLLVMKTLLGVLVVVLLVTRGLRSHVGLMAVCITTLLAVVNVANHWFVRPQLFTYTSFALMIALLAWCFEGWEGQWHLPRLRKRTVEHEPPRLEYSSYRLQWLWLVPVLLVFWTNSHGGFVAGFCTYAAYLGGRSVEALACRGRAATGLVLRLSMMVAAAGLATFLNPYGPFLHTWLAYDLILPRPEIVEWWPPQWFAAKTLPLWLVAITTVLCLARSKRPRDFTQLVVLALTFWQVCLHQRHVPFFAILFGFWMPQHVEWLLQHFKPAGKGALQTGMSKPLRWGLTGGLCLVYGVLGFKLYDRHREMPVSRDKFPVSAMQYIADRNLRGNMVVTFNWAQYALAAFGPKSPTDQGILVQVDGRCRTCYSQELLDMHFDFVLGDVRPEVRWRSPSSPPPDAGRALEYCNPGLVLISRWQPHSTRAMEERRDRWVLLYQDELAQLWGRSEKYDDPRRPEFIPPSERRISDEPQVGSVHWPAFPFHSRPPNQS